MDQVNISFMIYNYGLFNVKNEDYAVLLRDKDEISTINILKTYDCYFVSPFVFIIFINTARVG